MTPAHASPVAAKRRLRLTIAAALTLLATLWAAQQSDDEVSGAPSAKPRVANSERTVSNNARPDASSRASKPAAQTRAWPDAPLPDYRTPWPAASALSSASWAGPAQPKLPSSNGASVKPVVAQPKLDASPPEAPNFPYTLIGLIDDGAPLAMLSGPARSFGVKVNEVIDGQWRVDAVGAQGISLTWLPGSIKKTVAFASS